ncbi:MAG: hypothetical protein ABIO39_04260 [Caulobacteraceae bacterium]
MSGSATILSNAAPVFRPVAGSSAALGVLTDANKSDAAKRDNEAITTLKSFGAMRKEARDATRTRVKQTVQRLREELKLIKQMWAGDPKHLARQISRIAKELKAALADYAQAAKDNGDSAGSASMGVDAAPAAPADGDAPTTDDQAAGKDDKPVVDPDTAKALAAYGRAANDDQARTDAETEARGDLDFARDVHDFVRKLREALQESRVRHAFNTTDRKGQLKAEEEAAKGLTQVDAVDAGMEADVRADFPGLGIALAPASA